MSGDPKRMAKAGTVKASEGHRCKLKMQVTAVNKALLGVSQIFDAGHEVVITKSGCRRVHNGTGQVVQFKRADGAYEQSSDLQMFGGRGSK